MSDGSQPGILFLLPTVLRGQRGPVAGWLNTAGWTAAASRLAFGVTVITPIGVVDHDSLRDRASLPRPATNSNAATRPTLPLPMKVAIKDLREWIRARSFARLVIETNLPDQRVVFVWQRHELFQRVGKSLADRLDCPLVIYVPAPKVWEARLWGVRRPGWEAIVERWGDAAPLHDADLVACVSDEAAEAVVSLGIDPNRIIVTPSTVDTELFRPDVDSSDERRRFLLEDRFVVGWAGSFRSFHGLDVLLDAIEEARSQVPNLVGLLVGDGPDRTRLEIEVERRGLQDSVRFTGLIPQSELPKILSLFDVAIVSGRADQSFHYSPLKMWEYLAMARAVVAPSVRSLAKQLQNGVHAVLVKPGDAHSLAQAVTNLAQDSSLRLRLGRAGRELAETAAWVHQLERVIGRLEIGGRK